MDPVIVKVSFNGDIRRVSIMPSMTLENFRFIVDAMFRELSGQTVNLSYSDGEDTIRIVSELDWQSALDFGAEQKVLRLNVSKAEENKNSLQAIKEDAVEAPKKTREIFNGPDVQNYESSGEFINWFSTTPLLAPLLEVKCKWSWCDQGWGNQKGRISANIIRNGRLIHTVLANEYSPHEKSDFSYNFQRKEFCTTFAGDLIQFQYLVGAGGGHCLFIDRFSAEVVYSEENNINNNNSDDTNDVGGESSSQLLNSNQNNNSNFPVEEEEEEEDPILSVFSGSFSIWEKKGQNAIWEKLSYNLQLSRSGKLKIGENDIKSIIVIPDGESISLGWNYNNDDGSVNTTQGEITITFGALRGYYWDEDISETTTTFDGWIQPEGDIKSDFRGILIDMNSWEYLSLVPNAIAPVVNAEEVIQNENEEKEKKIQEEEDAIDYYINYIGEIKETLISLEAHIQRDSIHWIEVNEREDWINNVKSSSTSFQLAQLINQFASKIDNQVFSWVNGVHSEITPTLLNPLVKSQDLAKALASIELSISWSGVIDEWKEYRPTWTSHVNDFPIAMKLKNLSDPQLALETFKKSLLEFVNVYVIPDALKWNADEKFTWLTTLSIVDTPVDVALLVARLMTQFKDEYLYRTEEFKEDNEKYIKLVSDENISVYKLSSVLLSIERNVKWSGVIDSFAGKLAEWNSPLKALENYQKEEKLYQLGDITSKEIGMKMIKSALVDMESYMKREAIDWFIDEEKESWIKDVRNANNAETLARLLFKFTSKIKPEFFNGNYLNLRARKITICEIANILLSVEISIPWTGVIDIFASVRDDWRYPLTQLVDALSNRTPYKSALVILRNSLIALENYLVRNVAKWNSNDERKLWKEEVNSVESLVQFGELIAQFILMMKKDTFPEGSIARLNELSAQALSPNVKIQNLLHIIVNTEANIPWSAVTPIFHSDRSSWYSTLVNLPQYSWPLENEDEELIGADKLEVSLAMRDSSLVRSNVKQANEAKKAGLINFANAEKSTLELIASGSFRAYSFPTTLQENDKISAVFQLQSFPNENLEFSINFLSANGPILRVTFKREANSAGSVTTYLRNAAGVFDPIVGANSSQWNDSFPFSPSQDFEVVATVNDNESISLLFDGVFAISNININPFVTNSIVRVCLAGKNGRVLAKNVNLSFSRNTSLIPE